MKYPWLITAVILLSCSIFLTCSRNAGQTERKQLFDYNWKFCPGEVPGAAAVEFDDKTWRELDLPHDWSIEGQIDPDNPSGNAGGYFPTGSGWYRKSFRIPKEWKDKQVSVYFEGVYMNAEVFMNGESVGMHPYGYTSFGYDLTPFLAAGSENVMAVHVDNSQQVNCRWYSGSGIYRHVWLLVTGPVYIGHWGVAINTPEVNTDQAVVEIKTLVRNETAFLQSIILSAMLTDGDGREAGSDTTSFDLPANSEKEVIRNIKVSSPQLWTPESPDLYRAQIDIKKDGKILDMTENTFGIRSISFSAEQGFLLNGNQVLLNGGCVHHDNGCLGAASFDRAEERRVELLKSAGFNAVRTSHNPPSEAFLDACDRHGLLVIDEAFDGWRESKTPYDYATIFDDWWQRDIESMVLRDRNHPSVIMWSIGNEIIERTKPEALETAAMLANTVRSIDPTRPVTSAMTTWGQGWEIFDPLMAVHDVCGYNYQLHYAESDHERVPSRIIVQTESFPKDAFFCWNTVHSNNYVIGDFVWTALDYLGESGIGRFFYSGDPSGESWDRPLFPWHAAYCGDIDLTGWRKPVSHYRNLLYNDTEKLYMAVREPDPLPEKIHLTMWSVWPTWESWTWPGYEGRDLQVEVCSRYPSVRLYLDDRLIGEQPTGMAQEFKTLFTLRYAPGRLKVVGIKDDQEMEETGLQTAGDAAAIKLSPDRTEILASGQDLSFVTIEITDGEGILQPNTDKRLQFEIEGPATIAGVDNGDIRDPDPYAADNRKTWHGRALVVIRSTRQPGEIILTAKTPGLPDGKVSIKSLANQP